MKVKDLISAIWEANPSMAEPMELLKRLDKNGDFTGITKDINGTRLAKLCRAALETGTLSGEVKAEAGRIASILNTAGGYREGSGRPSTGRKRRYFYITDEEYIKVKELIEQQRREDK